MYRPGLFPPEFPSLLNRILYIAFWAIIFGKWLVDNLALPLRPGDWTLYLDIHIVSLLRLRRLPNLWKPRGYNDQVKWLMLFAQHELMPTCVDKVRVREYVSASIGDSHLIPLVAASEDWADIAPLLTSRRGVLKLSHDSGSALLFDRLRPDEVDKLEPVYSRLLSREYGVGKGEWAYGLAQKKYLVEVQLAEEESRVAPHDIKIHCVRGEPKLVHIIGDRQGRAKQAFFLPDGTRVFPRIKTHRESLEQIDFDSISANVLPLARILAQPFLYVRADFYLAGRHAYFGELTFYEESGLFGDRKEEAELAHFLSIPCRYPRGTIHRTLRRCNE